MQVKRLRLSVAAGAAIVGTAGLGLGMAGACGTVRSTSTTRPTAVTSPGLITCAGHKVVAPVQYTMPCADGDAWVTGMHWTSWSARGARGSGTLVQDNCVPNCAAGTFVDDPAQVQVAGVVRRPGVGVVFTHMVVQYRPVSGPTQTETFYLAT